MNEILPPILNSSFIHNVYGETKKLPLSYKIENLIANRFCCNISFWISGENPYDTFVQKKTEVC